MESSEYKTDLARLVEVNGTERWSVFHRLRELEIPCWCEPNQPLRVYLSQTIATVQFWSVSRQMNASRQELVRWLEQCWQMN
ncbi:Asr1405/Asl0597 family protein [Oscillatoria sp. HE19RPO]|uniref:Asr1405/Asl0597 family protein n=1 Tax=Oscillatoria sp. HE19RPO TaxID=2954806 RepID=UPI0020C4642E|nr:Asr1405/Asl0597 family protein [Oscillatoria sp. HE19RPO]